MKKQKGVTNIITLTADQVEILKANYKTISRLALAKKMGITKGTLDGNMYRMGLKKNCKKPPVKRAVIDNPGFYNEAEYKATLIY